MKLVEIHLKTNRQHHDLQHQKGKLSVYQRSQLNIRKGIKGSETSVKKLANWNKYQDQNVYNTKEKLVLLYRSETWRESSTSTKLIKKICEQVPEKHL